MAEYIDKQAFLERMKKADRYFMVKFDIESFPAAEVEQVRHGQWEGTADGYADGELVYDMWNCSECGFDADGAEEKPEWKFCPNCGAWMDGWMEVLTMTDYCNSFCNRAKKTHIQWTSATFGTRKL